MEAVMEGENDHLHYSVAHIILYLAGDKFGYFYLNALLFFKVFCNLQNSELAACHLNNCRIKGVSNTYFFQQESLYVLCRTSSQL